MNNMGYWLNAKENLDLSSNNKPRKQKEEICFSFIELVSVRQYANTECQNV
jgi:hypothetical protein